MSDPGAAHPIASAPTLRAALPVVVLVALAFVPSLGYPFSSWDDPRFVTDNLMVRSFAAVNLDAWVSEPIAGKWRPLTWASFALDDALFGLNPVGYRITALGLHLLAVLGVLALGLHAGLSRDGAVVAALVFGLHPAVVEPVVWITARNYVISTPLVLAAVLLAARPQRSARLAAVLCTLLALLAHELAVVTPLLVALDAWRRRVRPTVALPHLALAIVFGAIHLQMARAGGILKPELAASPAATLAGAAALALAPARLSPVYTQAACLDPVRAGAGALVLVALAIAWWRARRSAPARLGAFALAWVALAFLPTAGLVPTENALADRWLYLPLAGAALAFGHACAPRQGSRGALAGAVLVVVALAALALAEQRIWRSPLALWERGARVAPSFVTHQNLGGACLELDLPQILRAEVEHELAIAAAADARERALGLTGLARAKHRAGADVFARDLALRAVAEDPRLLPPRVLLAQLADVLDAEARLDHARIAVALAPDEPGLRDLIAGLTRAAGAPPDEVEAAAASARATWIRGLRVVLSHDPASAAARAALDRLGR